MTPPVIGKSHIPVRTEKTLLGRWWWSVDRWTLGAIGLLIIAGIILVTAASPAVANRIGLPDFHFVYRHLVFLIPCIVSMIIVSMLGRKNLWRLASLSLVVFIGLAFLTLIIGDEIKGATRWIHLFGLSLQPSEFLKPAFAVTSAWLLARHQYEPKFPGMRVTTLLFAGTLFILLLQPDFGMSFVLACIWASQIFLAGLPMVWVIGLGGLGIVGIFAAYTFLPHVASRIDRFLDPTTGDNYQVQKSLEAFNNGGLFGTGPGQGKVQMALPDAHSDFIFAVSGEELGLVATLFIVAIFCFIIVRSITRALNSEDLFIILGTGGLLTQFALQTLIHMGSSIQLLPAKGMTLPFISYGGSSLLALGFGMGMLLSLTRKRPETTATNIWRNRTGKNNKLLGGLHGS